jgi:hypothetical protein
MDDDHNDDAKQGKSWRKAPPEGRRYKPGQSGNPTGRPPSSKVPASFDDLVRQIASTKISVVDRSGRRRKTTKAKLVAEALIHGALKGDPAMLKIALPIMAKAGAYGKRDETLKEAFDSFIYRNGISVKKLRAEMETNSAKAEAPEEDDGDYVNLSADPPAKPEPGVAKNDEKDDPKKK